MRQRILWKITGMILKPILQSNLEGTNVRHSNRNLIVCYIVTIEDTATNFLNGYLEYLVSQGWTVWVIASGTKKLRRFAESQGAKSVIIPMRRDPAPFRDIVSLIGLVFSIGKIRPSVVVSATPKASLLGGLAGMICFVPVRVYQLWGLRMETEFGIRRRVLLVLEKVTALLSSQVVANSASLVAKAVELGVVARNKITVLGPGSSHGVDINHFSRDAVIPELDSATREFLDQGADLTTIGYIGRVHVDKGIDTFIEALMQCAESGLRLNVIVVGAHESQSALDKLNFAAHFLRIHLVGPAMDVRPYYNAIDFLCLPSRREGFPNVVIEAAAMSVPSISSDATGAIDSVIDGYTGSLFEMDDSRDLASSIRRLASDPEYCRKLGLNARKHIKDNYSSPKIWELQERHLRAMLKSTNSR